MAVATLEFKEEYSAKLPALALLCNLGWTFMSPEQALAARGGKRDQVVLRDVLREELGKRRFSHAGREYPLSDKAIDTIIGRITSPSLNEGLGAANERLYDHLMYGITVTDFVEGKKTNPITVALVDWHNVENNSFLVTEEFTVQRSGSSHGRRPDIVGFVNGIPMVVIEAKRPNSKRRNRPMVVEGITQMLNNQHYDEIPQLFVYSQLLLSISDKGARYATCGTAKKFWATWREEDISEAEMRAIKNRKLSEAQMAALFGYRKPEDREWYEGVMAEGERMVSEQDTLLISLLSPARLLEMTRFFTLFDGNSERIVARYQQVFSVKRLIERIARKDFDNGKGTAKREGGVIWHTTGSGKSLTMVFLSRALMFHDTLKRCRVVVVTDRVDLEKQLSRTFIRSGELVGDKDKAAAIATSGTRLAEQIGRGTERIIFSLIQKFNTATKLPECFNDSADIIVLVDEGHRSQGGDNHACMTQALPNAAFVAFTGTPLLKEDKTTNTFGPIIHAYTMQRAVEDGAVTPLLYEERIPHLDVNDGAIDFWFERNTKGLTEKQKGVLKRKLSRKGQVYRADDRIRLVALDIANHFTKNVNEPLKAQLACDSKASAIKYKRYLDELGLFESAVVISAPGTSEGGGCSEVTEEATPEVIRWWKENVGSQNEASYTDQVVARFDKDDNLKLLIVVDKLLTGFDEPKNSVLYIDKPLKAHNLIQAIARVNRLHRKKQFGYLIDYRGILSELDITIGKYQDLASRTQAGYDIEDLRGLYHTMGSEYKQLPRLYKRLWAIFDGVKNKRDPEAMRQVLVPRMAEHAGELVDVNLKVREDFFEALSQFANCLTVALQSASFYEDKGFSDEDRLHYKMTLKQFTALRQDILESVGESVDYDSYLDQIKKLMDEHVVGIKVKESEGYYAVDKMGKPQKPEEWSVEKTRNETDIIKTRITRMIEQELEDDPYAMRAFSKLLHQAIEEAEAMFDHPFKQYLLFKDLGERVAKRELDEIPRAFAGTRYAQAFYGTFLNVLPETMGSLDAEGQQKWIDLAHSLDHIVKSAVAENSINSQNIEATIRSQLLVMLHNECKAIGGGMEQAKAIIDEVVLIVRKGLNH